MNYSCLIICFHCLQFHAISFSSSARIRVRQEMSHRVNNVKQRTTLCWRASLYKKKARASVRYRIEACYHNDQAETRKITNAYKVFFLSELACQRHNALSSNDAVLISQSTANFSDVTVQPLQSLLNSVGGVESIFSIFDIPDLPISHSLFPYKEHIKQPRLRRHVAKTLQKSVFTLFQINFYHSYSISFKLIVKCW